MFFSEILVKISGEKKNESDNISMLTFKSFYKQLASFLIRQLKIPEETLGPAISIHNKREDVGTQLFTEKTHEMNRH